VTVPAEGGGLLDARGGGRLERALAALDDAALGVGGATLERSEAGFPCEEDVGASWVFFLWSRQQSAHRHSTTKSPFSARRRVSRQPNCALMSV
jgi:hypothetical protein